MAEMNGTMNGRPSVMNGRTQRKQLSDQLDRLDALIDALVNGLPEAVTAACKEGSREAVKDAIVEILATPELRALLVPRPGLIVEIPVLAPAPAPVPRKPNHWDRFKAKIAAMRDGVRNAASKVKNAIVGRCQAVRNTVAAITMAAGEKIPVRRILLVGLGVGLVVGIACLVTTQEVAAGVSAVTSASTAIMVQIGCWLKRAASRFGLVT